MGYCCFWRTLLELIQTKTQQKSSEKTTFAIPYLEYLQLPFFFPPLAGCDRFPELISHPLLTRERLWICQNHSEHPGSMWNASMPWKESSICSAKPQCIVLNVINTFSKIYLLKYTCINVQDLTVLTGI